LSFLLIKLGEGTQTGKGNYGVKRGRMMRFLGGVTKGLLK